MQTVPVTTMLRRDAITWIIVALAASLVPWVLAAPALPSVLAAPALPSVLAVPALPSVLTAPALPSVLAAPALPSVLAASLVPSVLAVPALPSVLAAPALPSVLAASLVPWVLTAPALPSVLAAPPFLLAVAPSPGLSALRPQPRGSTEEAIESSVVKILVRSNPPDPLSPWQQSGIETWSGSGAIIQGGRILTSAHVVEDAVSIDVKRAGSSELYEAEVAFVGHDCDLALLTVKDPAFSAGVRDLRLGQMPRVQDQVKAYGFPLGGETISVTSGILSRVEVDTYAHSYEELLLAQIDAAINPGNSGGPIVADGAIVGIAVQSLDEAQSVGYMVPVPVIQHFLADLADGAYDGFPRLGVAFQALESEAHRASLGMARGQSGALVTHVDHDGPADGILKAGDVLLTLGGLTVANDLTVALQGIGRVHLSQMYQSMQRGAEIEVSVLRGGKTLNARAKLVPATPLVPGRWPDAGPQYLVFGGVVFQPLTVEYLRHFEDDIPPDLANHAFVRNMVTLDRSQVILLQKVLPDSVNRGYQDWKDAVVGSVNGIVPRDMAHLARILDTSTEPWLRIVTENGSTLVLNLLEARRAQPRILSKFGLVQDRSRDLNRAVAAEARRP